jgi:hypothetical protein
MASDERRAGHDPGQTATVDQLIHDLRPLGRPAATAPTPPVGARPARSRLRPLRPPMRPLAVWACVGLGVLLGAVMPLWPYARGCGWGLSFYLFATAMVVISGVWALLISWKSRLAVAHALGLVTLLWGLTLTAQAVLPRVGYAKNAAAWTCPLPAAPQ